MSTEQTTPLHLVVVEDSELDYELTLAHLLSDPAFAANALTALRVEDEPGLRNALAAGPVAAVITDHEAPGQNS